MFYLAPVSDLPDLDERTARILGVAVELAERDGFDAVRLRDVASMANVALGTVYRRFACKEDILAMALELQVRGLRANLEEYPIEGPTGTERLATLFEQATGMLADRPKLAAAMLRTVASGVPELVERVARYQAAVADIIVATWRGPDAQGDPTPGELQLAMILEHVWFGALVGWTGGLHDADTVTAQVRGAADLLIRGLEEAPR
jgi:AcrR family transcriptional regulator